MFDKLLIANRGEIACRIARTARALGVRTVAVCSTADRHALHVRVADEAVEIGAAPPADSYLRVDRVVEAALRTGAAAVHPGYGFLSESAELARACVEAGLCFVGPPAAAIEAMGVKDTAKRLMGEAGVPVLPGFSLEAVPRAGLQAAAAEVGYPLLVKAVAGGGGKGMRRVDGPAGLAAAIEGAAREARAAFGDDRLLIEKLLLRPRHVEVQVFADRHGQVVHLFERDCSMQRRHQKVVEEAPAPGLPDALRQALGEAAVTAARAIGYEGAGTCEFLVDVAAGVEGAPFYFLEMNTRLQVEHPVTEAICGVDLVQWQLQVAAGEPLPLDASALRVHGHAVEARLYAEDPSRGYLPQTGRVDVLRWPTGEGVRVDAGIAAGDTVSMHYDPLLAKLIAHGDSREQALARLARALDALDVGGVRTNAAQLVAIVRHPAFAAGEIDTGFLERHAATLLEEPPSLQSQVWVLAAVAVWARRARRAADLEHGAAPGGARSPWSATDAFRINLPRFDTLHLAMQSERFELRVEFVEDGYRVQVGDARFAVSEPRLEEGLIESFVDGRRVRAGVGFHGDEIELRLGGRLYRLRAEEDSVGGSSGPVAGAAVHAPMPGKVLSVGVREGQAVQRGEPLLQLTAMKMEHTLTAEADAVVARVHVDEGAQVDEGDVLVELRPADESPVEPRPADGEGEVDDAG